MTHRRPALGAAAVCIAVVVLAFTFIGVTRGISTAHYLAAKDRATARVTGTVIEDDLGGEGDIRVRWSDSRGGVHVQEFGIYDTDRYVQGKAFKIRYDPRHPSARAYPADPDETSAEDDLWVPIMFAGVAGVGLLIAWFVRGLRYRLALRRPERRAHAEARAGDLRSPGPVSFGLTYWLGIRPAEDRKAAVRWQQVMWHPVLTRAGDGLEGSVHGDPQRRKPVVFETDSGARLVPIGRLRRKVPKRIVLVDLEAARVDLADTFIVPAGVVVETSRSWWRRRALRYTGIGAVVGGVFGAFAAGLDDAPSFAAAAAAAAVSVWGFRGAEP